MRKGLITFLIVAMAALLINGCVAAKKEKVSFDDITRNRKSRWLA
ncbi:hypothetical protein ACFLZ5_11475 [Thermodesulfobacteriota bacterium]